MNPNLLAAALEWHSAGYAVIPIRGDGSKAPAVEWEAYQHALPTAADVVAWATGHDGIGVVCGGPRHLEMLEVEGGALDTLPEAVALLTDNGLADLWGRIAGGYVERSPRGGLHWFMTVDGPALGNTRLARRRNTEGRTEVMWETRGQGGQVVVAPSNGTTSRHGAWTVTRGTVADIPTVTAAERDALHAVLGMLDRMPTNSAPNTESTPLGMALNSPDRTNPITGLRPGDDYNTRTDWADILTGWTRVAPMGTGWSWRRPGKRDGISATTGQSGDGIDRLYLFTTSTELDAETPYTKFAAYTALNHGGDYTAASRALRAAGYGSQGNQPPPSAGAPSGTPDAPHEDASAITEAIFDATPTLGHIRCAARARLIAPLALLGAVLARVVAEVPPTIVLPPIIGTRASINMYVGLVGPPGAAKTTAVGVARELLDLGTFPRAHVQGTGSGEGLIASYLEADPDEKGKLRLRANPLVCMLIDEIGQIDAIQHRQGSTLASTLRSGWSGAALDTINADPTRRRIVPAGSYRLTVVAGIQPLAATVLFADAASGTPQRWLWLPALDPHIPDEPPDWPGQITWRLPDGDTQAALRDRTGAVTVAVPDRIRDLLRAVHRARHRGQDTGQLDGHLALTRLKVAAALALLHGDLVITEQWWEVAGMVMAVSARVRDDVQAELADAEDRKAMARGRYAHLQDTGRSEAAVRGVEADARRVWRAVHAHAEGLSAATSKHAPADGCTRRCVTLATPRRTPEQRRAAIEYAADMGWIVTESDRLLSGPSQPAGGADDAR